MSTHAYVPRFLPRRQGVIFPHLTRPESGPHGLYGFRLPERCAGEARQAQAVGQSMVLEGSRHPPRSLRCRDHCVMASQTTLHVGLTPTRLTNKTPGFEPTIGRS